MATQTQATAAPRALKPYRLTVEQVEKMLVAGIFEGRGRFELLGGAISRDDDERRTPQFRG